MPRGNSPQNDAAAPGPVPLGIGLPGNPDDFMVVAIGASAGGLEACSKLLSTLSPDSGMAYIVVQHLDPVHESLLADLLAGHTALSVRQATDGMAIEPNHVYVIAPVRFCPSRKARCTSHGPHPNGPSGFHSISCCFRWRNTSRTARHASCCPERVRMAAPA